jgi:hypothetical protein
MCAAKTTLCRMFYGFSCALVLTLSSASWGQVAESQEPALMAQPSQNVLSILIDSARGQELASLKVLQDPRTGKASHLHFYNPKAKRENLKNLIFSLKSLEQAQPLIEEKGIDFVTLRIEETFLVIQYKPSILSGMKSVRYKMECDANGLNCSVYEPGSKIGVRTIKVVTAKSEGLFCKDQKDTGIEKIVRLN